MCCMLWMESSAIMLGENTDKRCFSNAHISVSMGRMIADSLFCAVGQREGFYSTKNSVGDQFEGTDLRIFHEL